MTKASKALSQIRTGKTTLDVAMRLFDECNHDCDVGLAIIEFCEPTNVKKLYIVKKTDDLRVAGVFIKEGILNEKELPGEKRVLETSVKDGIMTAVKNKLEKQKD